jgi:hypothetical protein
MIQAFVAAHQDLILTSAIISSRKNGFLPLIRVAKGEHVEAKVRRTYHSLFFCLLGLDDGDR